MYSNVNNKLEAVSTLSVKEMVGFIFIVSSSLYLLYPEGKIDKELNENREENRQLSIDYLHSMLNQNPNSINIGKRLIDKYHSNGELDKALLLIREFIAKTEESEVLELLYKKEYLILKEQYFQVENRDKNIQLSGLNEKLHHLFLYATDFKDYQFLFAEATSMDFKELRYQSLKNLLKEESVALKLKEDAVKFFISYKKMEDAESLVLDLVEDEVSQKRRLEHFKVAFYILAQDKVKNRGKIEKLIQLYRGKSTLVEEDLYLLSDAFLQLGQKKEAADFLYGNFKEHPELFTEKSSYEAIRVLSYNAQLKRALEVSDFVYKKYPSVKSLDSTIQLSTWLSKIERAVELNIEGWRKYDDKKYERYLLEKTTFNSAYKIRGEIYKKAISSGDFSMVKNLGEYFEYTGEIDKAEEYFNALVKRHPEKSIYKEAIRFSHDNSNFKRVDALYRAYREKFGMERELHKKLIDEYVVSKQLKRAYLFTQELEALGSKSHSRDVERKKADVHSHKGGEFQGDYAVMLKQLAGIEQDYDYLYKLLWKEEKDFDKSKNSYAQLINLESKLSKKPRLEYLYNRAWRVTENRVFLRPLLTLCINNKKYEKFQELISLLKPKDRSALEKLSSFYILMASYHQGIQEYDKALKSFETALSLDPKNSEVHQAYLWFLLNNEYYVELKSEFECIKKDKKLQKEIAFPSVVLALKMEWGDLALKWLTPLLKQDKENTEYQALYAEILDYQGEKERAKVIRYRLFESLKKEMKQTPKLQKNKEFIQLFLQMASMYKIPFVDKKRYLKRFKNLFSEKEFREIELGLYLVHDMRSSIEVLAEKHNLNYSWLNFYLATQRGDKAFAKKAYVQNSQSFSLQERVSLAMEDGRRDDAHTLLFDLMEHNQQSPTLSRAYWEMINEDFPKSKLSLGLEHLSREVSLKSMEFTTKYAINSSLDVGITLLQNKFVHDKKENREEEAVALSLSNHGSDLLWSFNLGHYFGDSDYYYGDFMINYHTQNGSLELNIGKNNETTLTPKLQIYGMENSIKLGTTFDYNQRNQFGVTYQRSDYNLKDGTALGEGEQLQLISRHLFRFGYPDITLSNHLSLNHFDFEEKNMGLESFTEIGSELTIGMNVKNTLHKSWKPYMSLGMAINDHQQVGSSVVMGVSGMLYRADQLDFSLRYIKGINNLNEKMYGGYLNYRY